MVFPGQKSLCLLHSYSLPIKGFLQSYLRLQPHLHFWWGMNLCSKSTIETIPVQLYLAQVFQVNYTTEKDTIMMRWEFGFQNNPNLSSLMSVVIWNQKPPRRKRRFGGIFSTLEIKCTTLICALAQDAALVLRTRCVFSKLTFHAHTENKTGNPKPLS